MLDLSQLKLTFYENVRDHCWVLTFLQLELITAFVHLPVPKKTSSTSFCIAMKGRTCTFLSDGLLWFFGQQNDVKTCKNTWHLAFPKSVGLDFFRVGARAYYRTPSPGATVSAMSRT